MRLSIALLATLFVSATTAPFTKDCHFDVSFFCAVESNCEPDNEHPLHEAGCRIHSCPNAGCTLISYNDPDGDGCVCCVQEC